MKKIVFWLYTVLRITWIPLVVSVPLLTVRQTGSDTYAVTFPAITLVPLFLILEVVLRRRYRKDFSLLSTKYWLVTGLMSWVIAVAILVLALPGFPLHNDNLHTPGHVESSGFVVANIIFASALQILMTAPEVISRRKKVGLYKKDALFK